MGRSTHQTKSRTITAIQPLHPSCLVVPVVTVAMQLGHCRSCGKRPNGMLCDTTICGAEKSASQNCIESNEMKCELADDDLRL